MTASTVRELVARCLSAAGVGRVFTSAAAAERLSGMTLEAVDSPALAMLLADADGRIGPGPGAALLDSGTLRLSSRPGGRAASRVVRSVEEIPAAVQAAAAVASAPLVGTATLELKPELDAPVPSGLAPLPRTRLAPTPAPEIPEAARTLVLAGPGVVRAGAVEGLRAFAAAGGFGVTNSWGAKGVFNWQSAHHMGTAGLQARDFELLGFRGADLVIATGLDPEETREEHWSLGADVVWVDPAQLAPLAASWSRPRAHIEPNDFMQQMSAVCMPLQTSEKFPLSPGRVIGDLRSVLAGDDLVIADPGPAGLWLARAFPTTALGSVVVPAQVAPGFAAAAALAAGLREPRRRALAVTTGPLDPTTEGLLETARRLRAALVLEVWTDAALPGAIAVTSVDEHAPLLRKALSEDGVRVICVPVDLGDTDQLVAVAGDVIAWPDLWPSI